MGGLFSPFFRNKAIPASVEPVEGITPLFKPG